MDSVDTIAKRITRHMCIVYKLHWHDLLQYEEEICKPEDSWSFKNWISFLIKLGLTEQEIVSVFKDRLTKCLS